MSVYKQCAANIIYGMVTGEGVTDRGHKTVYHKPLDRVKGR